MAAFTAGRGLPWPPRPEGLGPRRPGGSAPLPTLTEADLYRPHDGRGRPRDGAVPPTLGPGAPVRAFRMGTSPFAPRHRGLGGRDGPPSRRPRGGRLGSRVGDGTRLEGAPWPQLPEGGAKDARGPALEEGGPGGHRASAATSSASVFSGVGVRGPRGAQGACADTRSHAVAASKPRPALSSELAPFSFGSHLGALASILGCSPLDDGACPPPSHCWVDPVVFEVCQAPRHRGTKRRLYPHG